jgi:YHS domain-containing protein
MKALPVVLLFSAVFLFVCTPLVVAGGNLKDSGQAVHVNADGIAAGGADVVAYFSLEPGNGAVLGSALYSHTWRGATWFFSNQKNLDAFRTSPERYAPQYGGYCAWAIAHDKLATINPDMWAVVNKKLYLNYNSRTQKKWEKSRKEKISEADSNWPVWEKRLASGE